MELTQVNIADLVRTAGTQLRLSTPVLRIAEYAELLRDGVDMWQKDPPQVVKLTHAESGLPAGSLVLAAGFTRVGAAQAIGLVAVPAMVREGTLDDARYLAICANATNADRPTREDGKRKAMAIFAHPAFVKDGELKASFREIGRISGLSHPTVSVHWEEWQALQLEAKRIKEGLPAAPADAPAAGSESGQEGGEATPANPWDEAAPTNPPVLVSKRDTIEHLLTYAEMTGREVQLDFPVLNGTVQIRASFTPL